MGTMEKRGGGDGCGRREAGGRVNGRVQDGEKRNTREECAWGEFPALPGTF